MTGRAPRPLQESEHRFLLAAGDAAAALAAVFVSIYLWTLTAGIPLREALPLRGWWFAAAVPWVVGLVPGRRLRDAISPGRAASAIGRLAAVLVVAYLGIYFYSPRQALPRLLALYIIWEAGLLTFAWRLVYIWVFTRRKLRRRVVVLGAGPAGESIARLLAEPAGGQHDVIGFVDVTAPMEQAVAPGLPILGGPDSLPELAVERGVSRIILATQVLEGEIVSRLLACQEAEIDVVPLTTAYEQAALRVPVAHVAPDWLFTSFAEWVSTRDASRLAKRVVDLVGGVLGTALFLVLAAPIAMAVRFGSAGPVFYRQQRTGLGGRTFTLTKFRTMVIDAESDGAARWAGAGDSRITPVGRWLRRTRLDELPNFLSVLRGDMSLVGPRPERPEFVAGLEREIPLYRARHIARPGLTGWAQINYPYGDSVVDAQAKLEFDLYYLKHRSFLFDAWILLRTIGTVLSFRGR